MLDVAPLDPVERTPLRWFYFVLSVNIRLCGGQICTHHHNLLKWSWLRRLEIAGLFS
jgi:hypothetical protein